MKLRLRASAICLVLIVTAWGVAYPSAPARAEKSIPKIRQLHRRGEIRSLEAIVARARERFPEARLVEAELLKAEARLVYEVELIDGKGMVRELFFDARTGEPVAEIEEGEERH